MQTIIARTLLLTLLLLCATVAYAQDPHRPTEITLQTGVSSRYVATDGRPNSDLPVNQTAILTKLPLGIMAGIWHTTGFDSQMLSAGDDEIVVGAGWHSSAGRTNFEVGVKQFFNYGLRGNELIPEFEAGVIAINSGATRVRPYLNIETPISRGHLALEVSGGIEHEIRDHGIAFRHRASVQHNTRHNGHDAVTLITYRAGFVWRLNLGEDESTNLAIHGPRVHVYVPTHHAHGYHAEHSFGVTVELNWMPTAPHPYKKTIVKR